MKLQQVIRISTALFLMMQGMVIFAQTASSSAVSSTDAARRVTLAIRYPDDDDTSVDMIGTAFYPRARGEAEIERKNGRTKVELEIKNISHPQGLGSQYTTYVVWAIAPEGQADNLGELPYKPFSNKSEITVTTPYQTFGLIVTAEPHGMVKMPSPAIVAENVLREKTKGTFTASKVEYRGDTGSFYSATFANNSNQAADYSTPLMVLGARHAVEIARRANASQFASSELRQAETNLATLEEIWPRQKKDEERYNGEAREVMRLAEQARTLAVERAEQARLEAERRAASQAVTQAQSAADRARLDAERARLEAEASRAALARSENELAAARQRVAQAQTEAEKAKANEEVARLEAERARLESDQAKRERDALQQRLYISISEILETRQEARGLIVNLSDVLFDFNQATLKAGAREKLSKLAGILLAYPGKYRLEIEGHTDSVGSDEYNQKLSENRAASVRDYLVQGGIPMERVQAVRGFGKTRPVTTNDTAEGRQRNRRVEIVIADAETITSLSNR
jgi:outer membrane protein OmpA-like peptidoglycan-associated protein